MNRETLYFIRVGGTAMGGVAAAIRKQGVEVVGSEESLYEPMKSYLAQSGVKVIPSFDPANIAAVKPDRIVVGNAVSRGNPELEAALDHRIPLVSLPQLVAERLIGQNRAVVVTGTHGKTTTTAMASWLLESAGLKPGFMVGGVPGNFPVSCRPVPAEIEDSGAGIFVVEGDEYDTAFFDKRSKFLWYRPAVAILNNIEHDHADIFADLEAVKTSFRLFLRLVPSNGLVLANAADENVADVLKSLPSGNVQTFGLEESADWSASVASVGPEGCRFEVAFGGEQFGSFEMQSTGEHNVRNMLAAIAQAHWFGVGAGAIQIGTRSFRPPKRRMEVVGQWHAATVIDDFAHHPTAIRHTLAAVRQAYPDRRVWFVFEPRSNSTTRNLFAEEFKTCFDGAVGVFFGALDRPWRYTEDERLDTGGLVTLYKSKGMEAKSVSIEEGKDPAWGKHALAWLESRAGEGDVILIGSNGDVGGLRDLLKES